MKVLVISTNADEAGAPRHVESLVNGLSDKIKFILVFGEVGPVSERLSKAGHAVHIVKQMRTAISPLRDLVALLKIIFIIIRHKPELVHCHSAKAGMLGRLAALLTCRRWIYTVHGWGWRGMSLATGSVVKLIEKIFSYFPNGRFIYVAEAVKIEATKVLNLSLDKGLVIYNGVCSFDLDSDQDKFDSAIKILMPARLSSAKDHLSLILAFERFNDPASKLIFCGEGTDSESFKNIAKSSAPISFNRIDFLGQRSDMISVYEQCNVVALISNFEALPLSIIESMSCGKAIISTDVGGTAELITHGESGLLVSIGSVEEIVSCLQLFKDPVVRNSYGLAAKAVYENKFNVNVMLEAVATLYGND